MGFFSDWYHLGFDFALDGAKLDIDSAKSKVKAFSEDHPVATTAIGAVAAGGAGYYCAGKIASGLGAAGMLGKASTGTDISTLSGAALESASKAAIGGSVKRGEAIISTTCAVSGGAITGAVISKDK